MNTVISSDEYAAKGGCICPFCKSDNIEGGSPVMNEYGMTVSVDCHDCGETWTDEYGLIGYKE